MSGCVAVIPARGGSRRIARKNIRPFLGRPVLHYPIATARASGLFDDILVSTDDAEIAAVAVDAGASVPFLRPAALADDHTGIVGSANLNGRSLRWDTEASIRFDTESIITELRRSLARIWLGETEADITRAATWRKLAERNAALPPERRQGFALPYPLEKVRRFSRLLPILPDDMF